MAGDEQSAGPAGRRPRPLRSDAVANRERVLEAAVVAMKREGPSVPLATIAREANVGVGTLYRGYATREALFEALEIKALTKVRDLTESIVERESLTGIEAIREFLVRTVDHGSQLFLPYHGAPWIESDELAELGRGVRANISTLLHRGVVDGTIRDDIAPRDVIIFGSLMAQPLPSVRDWDVAARRQIDLYLRAIRP
ncbi:TetR/AcrR family transcriptional regulator [Aeromicrobium chenweiae]|nr:TetR/AcrR family transcriptional regulator [Aeromicrobium chenweiae]